MAQQLLSIIEDNDNPWYGLNNPAHPITRYEHTGNVHREAQNAILNMIWTSSHEAQDLFYNGLRQPRQIGPLIQSAPSSSSQFIPDHMSHIQPVQHQDTHHRGLFGTATPATHTNTNNAPSYTSNHISSSSSPNSIISIQPPLRPNGH